MNVTIGELGRALAEEIKKNLDLTNYRESTPAATWKTIDSAPIGASDKPETYFIGMKIERGKMLTATCYKNEHGVFEWYGGGMMNLIYWMPLPEPPTPAPEGE